MKRMTMNVLADHDASGRPVYEELLVHRLQDGVFRLVASPGLVLGLGAGDEIEVDPDTGAFTVHKRGGNLAVWVYTNDGMDDAIESLSSIVASLGGRIDGRARRLVVFTIPVEVGFAAVEEVFYRFVAENPGAEWYFGNVYDPADGVTPLNWWSAE